MASTGQLKRRLSGSGHVDKRSSSSSSPRLGAVRASQPSEPDPSTSSITSSKAGQRQKHGKEQQQALAPPLNLTADNCNQLQAGASKFTSEAKQSSWSLLKTWKLLASDDVEDHSHASFRIKGLEALGVVRKAADGIASTATTMATSLDEAVEQLFVGWTPAPPAPDHACYESSPNPSVRHCIHKSLAHSQNSSAAAAQGIPTSIKAHTVESSTTHQTVDQGACDSWGEWDSPFDSGSTSPEMSSQSRFGDACGIAIPAWHADQLNGAQQHDMRHDVMTNTRRPRTGKDDGPCCTTTQDISGSQQQLGCSSVEQRECTDHAQTLQNAQEQLQAAVEAAEIRRERVVQLQDKLQDTKAPPESLDMLRSEIKGALEEVATASHQCSLLSQQHQGLLQRQQATLPDPDPLADQVAGQLQALLTEKAHLAQENARLARENTGLQELLQYTMHQHLGEAEPMQAEHTDEFGDWASLDNALPDGGTLPSSENGSPLRLVISSRPSSPS
ncbi:TPA: hypothetical protein ACH3X2_001857 [Trebouxia sp. C0005]